MDRDQLRPDAQHEPVQAVAARWGFASATVFSRAFRTAFGTTPTEYRRQALESRAARTGHAAGVDGAARNVEKPCTPCTPPPQART
ncbi:helix-turn-helix domain-containing protein [Kitasatospora sp. NPDC051914]|uniref:helix-turn-helix domain-containing protein n=1 Tax=Kitasatospora sp. NPDC051914 TaxID=3154945 RepID=UPI0034405C92